MAVTITHLTITDDHTSRTAAEVMACLQLDQGSPEEKQKCDRLLRDLGFPSEHQNEEEYSQFVFNGQCLILGDSRVGKTSLVNALIKKPFDSEEPSTLGVRTNSVDQEWQNANLAFGSFARFGKSVRSLRAFISSGEYLAFEDRTSTLSLCMIWSLYLFSLMLLWKFPYLKTHLIVLHIAFFLVHFTFPCPLHFTLGLMVAHLVNGFFKGIHCCCVELPCIGRKHLDLIRDKFIVYIIRLFYLSPLTGKFIASFFGPLREKWVLSRLLNRYRGDIKISLPGQVKIYNHRRVFFWSGGLFYDIGSFMNGFGLGFCAELMINMSIVSYCEILHYTFMLGFGLSLLWFIRSMCKGRHFMEGIVSPIIFIFVIECALYRSRSSYSTLSYVALFAGCACCAIIFNEKYVSNLFACTYKLIFVQKVALDYQELRKALNVKFSSLTLGILDFGGEKENLAYHHLFYRNQAIYVIVFNLAHFAASNFQYVEAKIQRICFWLESIYSKVGPKAPIFLVGTHRGNMSRVSLGYLNKYLQQSLWQTFSNDLTMNEEDKLMYFPVESKDGIHDRGIKNLKRTMTLIAEENKTTLGQTIPFSWIKIQDAIINLWENGSAKFCVSLKHFPTSFRDFICSNWSKETLKYFHEKGLVIYIDKGEKSVISEWVLLKPSLLVDITIQLITPKTDDELFSQHGFRKEWTLLHNKGMLTNSLLRHILTTIHENEEAMTGFLEEYGIICPLFYKVNNDMTEAIVTHFVPALLPVSVNGNASVWNDHPTDKRLYVFFERFLPEPLFHRLLSRAHQLSQANFPKGQPLISRHVGRFWLTSTQPYRLLHLKEENIIEVTFSHRFVQLKDISHE